jgi:osmotically inducible protein OsmC
MALSLILGQAGANPESVETDASVYLRRTDSGFEIHKIELETVGNVPGIDEDEYKRHAETAKRGCPVSRALASVPEVSLEARLAG